MIQLQCRRRIRSRVYLAPAWSARSRCFPDERRALKAAACSQWHTSTGQSNRVYRADLGQKAARGAVSGAVDTATILVFAAALCNCVVQPKTFRGFRVLAPWHVLGPPPVQAGVHPPHIIPHPSKVRLASEGTQVWILCEVSQFWVPRSRHLGIYNHRNKHMHPRGGYQRHPTLELQSGSAELAHDS